MSLPPRTAEGRAPILVPSSRWDATAWRRLPALSSTALAAAAFAEHADFPTTEDLSALVRGRLSANGAPLAFERQTQKRRVTELAQAYDARIFHEGRVPTRERSWHDLFNALVWIAFPRAKRAVNARQYAALAQVFAALGKMPGARTREQDTLAMLDEGGLLLVTTSRDEAALAHALATNDQLALHTLVARGRLHTLVFGHALAEHLVSSDARVRGLPVPLVIDAPCFLQRSVERADFLDGVDHALAAALEGSFARSSVEESRGERPTGSIVAIDLRPELFLSQPAPTARTLGDDV